MEPKLLEMKLRRHQSIAANNEELFTANGRSCLAHVRAEAGSDLSPWLLTERTRKTLLLVSDDANLGVRVSAAADLAKLAFQQANDAANALRLTARDYPAIVLLDLDMPASAGWNATERFLADDNGPPLGLMTGRTGHFDLGMAICAGMVLDKSIVQRRLLEQVHVLLERSGQDQERYLACLRLLVHWLRTYELAAPTSSEHRHWGINE